MPAGNTFEAIATNTVSGSSTTTVTFSSISSTYTDLFIVFSGSFSAGDTSLVIRFNGDTGSNYSYTLLEGNGSSASSTRGTSTDKIYLSALAVSIGSGTNISTQTINVMNYANTTTYKTAIGRVNTASNSTSYLGTSAGVGLWRNTAAINSVSLIAGGGYTITAGSTFTLYGILAA